MTATSASSNTPTGAAGPTSPTPDPERVQAFMQRWAADQAATVHAATVVVGERLGLYRALADGGPQGAETLATATGCHPRLVREWLGAQVASGYCEHDDEGATYWLTPEQAACLADPASPTYVAGGARVTSSNHKDTERVVEAFTSDDGGIGWEEHHHDLFTGTELFFGPVYRTNLVDRWIPALDGVDEKLRAGARVIDVGCGHGVPLLLLAEAYPASTFVGVDYHAGSIDAARAAAAAAGVDDRVSFEVAGAEDFDGTYDLVCVFNALHEWGDPVRAARHIRESLAPEGTWMFTEPRTDDQLVESTRARTFFSVSTLVCTPSALSQGGVEALGAQAGEDALRRVATEAGFGRFRRATETPTFMVLEARP